MAVPTPLQEPPDFSLVLGGPLYQMLWRAHLTGPAFGKFNPEVAENPVNEMVRRLILP